MSDWRPPAPRGIQSGNDGPILRRVFVSMPADGHAGPLLDQLKWDIVGQVEEAGYFAEIIGPPRPKGGLATGKSWNVDLVDQVARRCIGGVVIGLPRWQVAAATPRGGWLTTEYAHYEAAVLATLRLPMLLLVHQGVEKRGIFGYGAGPWFTEIPQEAGPPWIGSTEFRNAFGAWRSQLDARQDLFLGYSSKAPGLARNVKNYLTGILRLRVHDWEQDFAPSVTILDGLQAAAELCSGGVFLFTKDDDLAPGGPSAAAPRDNVIFEAGYFAQAKGPERVLIIREEGSKMPADLGGQIYAPLQDRTDITGIEPQIRRFVETRL